MARTTAHERKMWSVGASPKLMTPQTFRMAKGALDLNYTDIQAATGLHRNTIMRAESGGGSTKTLRVLRTFFEGRGIVFVDSMDSAERGVLLSFSD